MSSDNSMRTSIDNNENVFSPLAKNDEQFANEFANSDAEKENNKITLLSTQGLNNIDNSYELGNERNTLIKRFFSSMEAGSLRGSIFAMSSLALGTGCLSIPLRFSQMGFLAGCIMLVLGGIVSYWSLTIMIEASRKSGGANDYSKLHSYRQLCW